jgi:hypothetical protein
VFGTIIVVAKLYTESHSTDKRRIVFLRMAFPILMRGPLKAYENSRKYFE